MTTFLTQIDESQLFPDRAVLDKVPEDKLKHLIFEHILALVMASANGETHYAKDTAKLNGFTNWSSAHTDLYKLLYASRSTKLEKKLNYTAIIYWLRHMDKPEGKTAEHRLLINLDAQLGVHDITLKSIRRICQSWCEAGEETRELAARRLLQIMKKDCYKSDLIPMVKDVIRDDSPECALEEDADGGATTAGNIATVVQPLGAVIRRPR